MKATENRDREFLAILERHIGIIVKIANVYARSIDDRQDLMGEIVFELWRSFPKFAGNAKVSTWLYRVALNTALKTKRRREAGKLLFVGELIKFERDPYEESTRDRAEIEQLYRCIEKLSPENKAIILLWLDDKSGDEIAEITGLSRTNVTTRVNRIKSQLKICMNDENR